MAFQTFENDENNRRQIKRKNLKTEIRSTWLGIVDVFQKLESEIDKPKASILAYNSSIEALLSM